MAVRTTREVDAILTVGDEAGDAVAVPLGEVGTLDGEVGTAEVEAVVPVAEDDGFAVSVAGDEQPTSTAPVASAATITVSLTPHSIPPVSPGRTLLWRHDPTA